MYTIYALVDPRDHTVHYVGQTTDVYKRFSDHINGKGGTLIKTAWIFELRSLNKMVIMETLEEVETYDLCLERELYWIKYFESLEEPICNVFGRGSLKRLREEQSVVAQTAISHGIRAMRRRRVAANASLNIVNSEDVGRLFFKECLSPSSILRMKWPHVRGGEAYQRRSKEIADLLRAYVSATHVSEVGAPTNPELTEREIRMGEMFFVERVGINEIMKEFFPGVTGGDRYQKANAEITDAIRKYAGAQKGA